jgi:large subunit ribosomal protein L29
MAKAKSTKEFRDLEDNELETRLTESKQELFNLRFQLVTGQLDNSSRVNTVRKDVARINTLLREREIAAAEAATPAPTTTEETG